MGGLIGDLNSSASTGILDCSVAVHVTVLNGYARGNVTSTETVTGDPAATSVGPCIGISNAATITDCFKPFDAYSPSNGLGTRAYCSRFHRQQQTSKLESEYRLDARYKHNS